MAITTRSPTDAHQQSNGAVPASARPDPLLAAAKCRSWCSGSCW